MRRSAVNAIGSIFWLLSMAPVWASDRSSSLAEHGVSLSSLLRIQGDFSGSTPSGGFFNPGNQLARLNEAEFNFELRPDFSLSYRDFELMLKPRLTFAWERIDTSDRTFGRDEYSAFVNEWRLRWALHERWFLAYGREVLLWGPAMSLSPSNPFFVDNGRANPFRELGGRDYLQILYLPNSSWTFALISNTAQGRGESETDRSDFERTDAIKIDYVGKNSNGGLLLAHRQESLSQVGGYFQQTLSDALLAYAEAGYTYGTPALYAQRSADPPGWTFADAKREKHDLYGISLIGLAYTFEAGPTVNVEYIHNSAGYSDQEARDYFDMAEQLGAAFIRRDFTSVPLLAEAASPRTPLLRRNYLFAQLLDTNIGNQLDITLRYTRNLDDDSGRFIAVFDWAVNDFTHLYALGLVSHGDERSEFRRYLDRQWLVGFNLMF